MSEFKITGPGFYRTRDGRKAEVKGRNNSNSFPWFGSVGDDVVTWRDSGSQWVREADLDLVAPWVEPWKPEVGKRAKHASARAVTVIAARGDFAWVEDRSNCPFTAFVTSLSPPDPEIHTGKVGPYEVKVTVADDKATAEIVR